MDFLLPDLFSSGRHKTEIAPVSFHLTRIRHGRFLYSSLFPSFFSLNS